MLATANALRRATLCRAFSFVWLVPNRVAVTWCVCSVYHQLLTLGHKKRRQAFQLKSCRFYELSNLTRKNPHTFQTKNPTPPPVFHTYLEVKNKTPNLFDIFTSCPLLDVPKYCRKYQLLHLPSIINHSQESSTSILLPHSAFHIWLSNNSIPFLPTLFWSPILYNTSLPAIPLSNCLSGPI